jgi:hypothetical protein
MGLPNYQTYGAPYMPAISGAVDTAGSVLATGAQTQGAANAINTQNQYWGAARGNASPYMQAGGAAVNQLGSFYGLPGYQSMDPTAFSNMLTSLPGYQFNLTQGVKAIDASAASKGLLNSGATGQALTQFGQGLAGNYLNNYVQGLTGLAGLGQNTALQTNALGQRYASDIGSAQIYQGNAKAGGYTTGAAGVNQLLQGLPGAVNYASNMLGNNSVSPGDLSGYNGQVGSDINNLNINQDLQADPTYNNSMNMMGPQFDYGGAPPDVSTFTGYDPYNP